RVDHLVLRPLVSALDQFGQLDLLRRSQQGVAPGLVEEELKRVGRHRGDRLVREVRLGDVGQAAVVAELDPALLELLVERRGLVVFGLELAPGLRERGEVDAARLLGVLHQYAKLIVAHGVAIASRPGSLTRPGSEPRPWVDSETVKPPDTLWELVFLMVI